MGLFQGRLIGNQLIAELAVLNVFDALVPT